MSEQTLNRMDVLRGYGCSGKCRAYRFILLVILAAAGISLSACNRKVSVYSPSRYQTGLASWYGKKFQSKRTASGEKFDMQKLTAAHKTLPFNTLVLVENLKNGRTVRVRINDRGPFVEGRIIDLSRKAAEKLGMIVDGVVPVRIEILKE